MFDKLVCGSQDYYEFDLTVDEMRLNKTKEEQININQIEKGRVCFYKIKTFNGVLNITLDLVQYPNNATFEFIDFQGDLITNLEFDQKLSTVPMASKEENFLPDEKEEKVVSQGRIFFDIGSHFWGSQVQGENYNLKTDEEGKVLEKQETERYTYLMVSYFGNTKSNMIIKLSQTLAIGSTYLFYSSIIMIRQSLLSDQFEKKSSKFDKHYSSVVRRALDNNNEYYKPNQITEQWVVKDSQYQHVNMNENQKLPAENKFIQKSLNLKFQKNAPPILMPSGKKDFDVSNYNQSQSKNNDSWPMENYYQFSIKDRMKAYSANMSSYKKLLQNHKRNSISRSSNRKAGQEEINTTKPDMKGVTQHSFSQVSPNQSNALQESIQVLLGTNLKRPVSSTVPNNRRRLTSSQSQRRTNYMVSHQIRSQTFLKQEDIQKQKRTNIEEIDKYYQSLNNLSEIQKIQFITEYQRLYDQISKIWNANKFPQKEQQWVNEYLQRKVDRNHYENPLFLKKLNSYILYMQKYVQLKSQIKNIFDDRESHINRLKQLAQKNNFSLIKTHGVNIMIQLRNLTIKLLQVNHQYQKLFKGKNGALNIDSNECYLCQIKTKEVNSFIEVSQILKQIGFFISDYLFFIPKTALVIEHDLKKENSENEIFTPQEVSAFEIMCHKLRKGISDKRNTLEKCLSYLIDHDCLISDNLDEQVILQEDQHEQEKVVQSDFLKFNWKIEENEEQIFKKRNFQERVKKAYQDLTNLNPQTININIGKEAKINQQINMFHHANESFNEIPSKLQNINFNDISLSQQKEKIQEEINVSQNQSRKISSNYNAQQSDNTYQVENSQRTAQTQNQTNQVQIQQDYNIPSQYKVDSTEKYDESQHSFIHVVRNQGQGELKSTNREAKTEMKSYKEYRILEDEGNKKKQQSPYKKVKSLIKVYQPMEQILHRPSSNAVSKRRSHAPQYKDVSDIYEQTKKNAKTPLNNNDRSKYSSESFLERLNQQAINLSNENLLNVNKTEETKNN